MTREAQMTAKLIKVDVSLADDEKAEHGYKALRGVAIMERYFEKEGRKQ